MTWSAFAAFLYRWRFWSSGAALLGALVFIPQADLTRINNDLGAWIAKDDPTYIAYETFRKEFGGTRNLIFVRAAPRRPYRDVIRAVDLAKGAGFGIVGYMP